MKATTDTDLLGETKKAKAKKTPKMAAADAAKPSKGKKAKTPEAADTVPAADTQRGKAEGKKPKLTAEEKKARREERRELKGKRKVAGVERTPVDQTPHEIERPFKLNAKQIELLAVLHKHEKPLTPAEIAATILTNTDTKDLNKRAAVLIEHGLVKKDEKLKYLEIVGDRLTKLGELVAFLTDYEKKEGHLPTSAQVGVGLWADPKKPGKRDTVRFGRPAGNLLQSAFKLGAIRKFHQARRKYSADKIRKLYGAVV